METIGYLAAMRLGFMDDRAAIKRMIFLHTPCVIEIIFTAGAVDAGALLTVDKDHVISLAPPGTLEMYNRKVAADIMTGTINIKKHIVIPAIQIRYTIYLRSIDANIFSPAFAAAHAVSTFVEKRKVLDLFSIVVVGGVEEKSHRAVIFVDDFDLCVFIKRHGEIAIHGCCSTKSALLNRTG